MSGPVIRPALDSDLASVIRLHREAFPAAFMTTLGPLFLRAYYRLVLAFPGHILLLAEETGVCLGLVAGFIGPAAFYREMKRRRPAFLPALAAGLLRHPLLAPRALLRERQVSAAGRPEPATDKDTCELSSIAVSPKARGRGVGALLTRRFAEDASRRGAQRIVLTTDADGNDAVNHFYLSLGFIQDGTFHQTATRRMHRYRLDLPMPT